MRDRYGFEFKDDGASFRVRRERQLAQQALAQRPAAQLVRAAIMTVVPFAIIFAIMVVIALATAIAHAQQQDQPQAIPSKNGHDAIVAKGAPKSCGPNCTIQDYDVYEDGKKVDPGHGVGSVIIGNQPVPCTGQAPGTCSAKTYEIPR